MANLQRWMNFIHIKSLVDILEAAPDGYGETLEKDEYLEHMNYFKNIGTVTLQDGKPIVFEDPAVALFLSMVEFDPSYEEETLNDLLRHIKRMFREKLKNPGMHDYQLAGLDEIFASRHTPGAWEELDRLIKYIAGHSLTELVERNHGKIVFDPTDLGLGGHKCFAINFMMSDDTYSRYMAFASDAKTIVSLIQPALNRIGSEHETCRATPDALIIELNEKTQCMLPVSPTNVSTVDWQGGGFHMSMDFSRPLPNWRTFSWHKHDMGLLKAVVAAAPDDEKRRIKGEFLADEMGL